MRIYTYAILQEGNTCQFGMCVQNLAMHMVHAHINLRHVPTISFGISLVTSEERNNFIIIIIFTYHLGKVQHLSV